MLTVPKSDARDDRESMAVAVDLSACEFVATLKDSRFHFVFRDAGVDLTSPQSVWTTESAKLHCRRHSDDCRNLSAFLLGRQLRY